MPDDPTTISFTAARRLALRSQLLAGRPAPSGPAGTLATIEHLGYVQIDTISVVARAHHHVLWTRQPGYDPANLDHLLAVDRTVFECWTHAASYVPMSDYRYYLGRMAGRRDADGTRSWIKANRKLVDLVLGRIREEGPLASADFADPRKKRGSWWDWKPAKRALELLFDSGELMVSARRSFQRVYDLSERVLPAHVDTRPPAKAEQARFLIRRSLKLFGLLTAKDIVYRGRGDRDQTARVLPQMINDGELLPLRVRGVEGENFIALKSTFEGPMGARAGTRLHILSPFDNLVIRRAWLESNFDFDYSLECYIPEAKRKFGYFTLPLLWGDSFVGRMDAKADRKDRVLIVRNLWFEAGFEDFTGIADQLAAKLMEFASFNGCDRVRMEKVAPGKAGKPVEQSLGRRIT